MGPVLVHEGGCPVKEAAIRLEDGLYEFYRDLGRAAGGRSAESVMADTLRWVAEELARRGGAEPE